MGGAMGAHFGVGKASGPALRGSYGPFTAHRRSRMVSAMDYRVLGTIEVAGPIATSSPPGAKERAILARLLLDAGRPVPIDELLDAAWEGVPRDAAARSLAVRVANLRSYLEPDRDRAGSSGWRTRTARSGTGRLSPRPTISSWKLFRTVGPAVTSCRRPSPASTPRR